MSGAPRRTRQKQAVYDALLQLDHPTATEVYEYVHPVQPTLSRGTVFRVLGGFAASGQVRKLTMEGSDTRFDPTLAPHAHGRCRVCGRVCDIFLPDYASIAAGAVCGGFQVEGWDVEFTGLCPDCSGNLCAKAQKNKEIQQ